MQGEEGQERCVCRQLGDSWPIRPWIRGTALQVPTPETDLHYSGRSQQQETPHSGVRWAVLGTPGMHLLRCYRQLLKLQTV